MALKVAFLLGGNLILDPSGRIPVSPFGDSSTRRSVYGILR